MFCLLSALGTCSSLSTEWEFSDAQGMCEDLLVHHGRSQQGHWWPREAALPIHTELAFYLSIYLFLELAWSAERRQ